MGICSCKGGCSMFQQFMKRAFCTKDAKDQINQSSGGTQMKKVLGAVDLTLMGIGGIIGSGVFVLTGLAANKHAGPAVSVSYLISAVAALLSALCFAEYAAEMPVAGGPYNYALSTFGELPAWICACNIMMETTLGGAAIARGFTSYFGSIFGVKAESLRISLVGPLSIDVLAFCVVFFVGLVLAKGMKDSSITNHIVSAINLAVIALIVCVGVAHVRPANYQPFAPFGMEGVLAAASQVFFSFLGFNSLCSAAEEVKNPGFDLPVGIVASLSICTVLYVLMCVVITGMRPYYLIDIHAPFSVAFHDLGIDWARTIIALGAVTGIATSMIVNMISNTRMFTVLGRDYLIPTCFGKINEKTRTPINATILSVILSGLLALLIDIEILAKLVSAGSLLVFLTVCLGILYRTYQPPEKNTNNNNNGSNDLHSLQLYLNIRIILLVLNCCILTIAYISKAPIWTIIIFLIFWVIITASFLCLPVQYTPQKFKVPLKPFVPSLGVLATIQLLGSLGKWAYLLFSVWQVVSFLVYVFYGMGRCEKFEQMKQFQQSDSILENNDDTIELAALNYEGQVGKTLLGTGFSLSSGSSDQNSQQNNHQ